MARTPLFQGDQQSVADQDPRVPTGPGVSCWCAPACRLLTSAGAPPALNPWRAAAERQILQQLAGELLPEDLAGGRGDDVQLLICWIWSQADNNSVNLSSLLNRQATPLAV